MSLCNSNATTSLTVLSHEHPEVTSHYLRGDSLCKKNEPELSPDIQAMHRALLLYPEVTPSLFER